MSGTVLHRNLTVLVVSDARTIEEIEAVVALDEYIIARISETELVVDPARVGELSERLSARGLAPLMKKSRR